MTVLNLMLGKERGGLEQASLDYAEALRRADIDALTLIAPGAWIEASMVSAGVAHQSLPHCSRFDPLAIFRLRRLAKRTRATAIICHGNRALTLALLALRGRVPVIAVAHNYQVRRFAKADGCLAITRHLMQHLHAHGATRVALMPNMVRIPSVAPHGAFRNPPVIGTMGRFVAKKKFDLYLEALALLKARGVPFEAILGGDGDDAPALRALLQARGLEGTVRMTGWVRDKTEFFAGIDLFVLPSQHEPFGLVLIEAMAYGVPLVTTDAEGPGEIVAPGVDALLVPRSDAAAMADALEKLLRDEAFAHRMAEAAREKVNRLYTLDAMADRLKTALPALTSAA